MSLFERMDDLLERGESVALLTIVGKDGSAPREVGARMLVTENAEYGTIGGGSVEGLAIGAAREVLAGEADPGVRTYDLRPGGNTGMVCGGEMDVFVDRLRGRKRLYIAGGGHIATDIAFLAERLGYDLTVIDDRAEYAIGERFPDSTDVIHGGYGEELSEQPITDESAVAVATRSNTFDARAVGAALDGGAGYVGLVASETKADRVLESLAEGGYAPSTLARVRAPVGLDLGGSDPADVALSILAEVNRDRYGASGDRTTTLDLDRCVVVRGGGDLGSGVAYRLHRAGYPVIVTDVAEPTVVRRAVAFGTAIYDGEASVEGVCGRQARNVDEAISVLRAGDVAVLADPEGSAIDDLEPMAVVDAIMAKGKYDTGTRRTDAEVVIGLGPGFEAGADVDAVIETDRGHELGRALYEGIASAYDGEPGTREGYTHERVFYAPTEGVWEPTVKIGECVTTGDRLGTVAGEPVSTEIDGLIRGLVHSGVAVEEGTKLGDVDPRGGSVDYRKISDKALCLGGGVLEALLRLA